MLNTKMLGWEHPMMESILLGENVLKILHSSHSTASIKNFRWLTASLNTESLNKTAELNLIGLECFPDPNYKIEPQSRLIKPKKYI